MEKVKVWLQIQNMAQQELLQHVEPAELKEIQEKHDAIEAYGVAHEGVSRTNVVGEGPKKLRWLQEMIDVVKRKIKPGTPIFYLHNKDNSSEFRAKIGKVLKTIKTAGGDVVSIIRRFKDGLKYKCDAASFEATLDTPAQIEDGFIVRPPDLGDITGIALCDSAIFKPAFGGALRKACIQCYVKEEKENMPLSEILKAIQEEEISPLQIFSPEQILELNPVKEALAAKKGNENLYQENQRLQAQKTTAQEAHQKEIDEINARSAAQQKEILKYQVKDTYAEQIKERKELTPAHLQFIEMEKERLSVDPEKDIKEQINGHIDNSLKRFDATAAIINPGEQQKEETGLPRPEAPRANSDEIADLEKYLPD